MTNKHRHHTVFFLSIYVEFEVKPITWLPCKLLHVPETHDEQEDVVGESFLDIYRIRN